MIPAWLLKNPLASVLGGLLLVASLSLGVQTLRVAWLQTAAATLKAEQGEAIRKAEQAAQVKSDKIITEQAQALAVSAAKTNTVTERIIHAPVTASCGPVMRDATRGVRSIISGDSQPKAGSGAPPAVR